MEPFKLRVVDEYADLVSKIDALTRFVSNQPYKELVEKIGKEEYDRLQDQLTAMYAYRDSLRNRIREF